MVSMTFLFCKICTELFKFFIALISRQYLSKTKIFVSFSIQSVSFQYVSLFLKKPASRKYLPLGVLILDWWCVLKAWAVNVFGMVNLIEPRFWLGGFFVLVNSIKFDQSGAAGGSRSDTHRGVNTFEKLAFSKIKRHIPMKPIVF